MTIVSGHALRPPVSSTYTITHTKAPTPVLPDTGTPAVRRRLRGLAGWTARPPLPRRAHARARACAGAGALACAGTHGEPSG